MGTSVTNLIGSGVPAQAARHLGSLICTIAGVGTAQAGAALIANANVVVLTTGSGQTAFVFNAGNPVGTTFKLFNTTATTALIYPELGGQINLAGANAAFSLVQNKGAEFVKIALLTWVTVQGA
jgi:hypothetical protein